MRITDPLTAWCLNEAMLYMETQLEHGRRIAPKTTTDNSELIRQMKELQGAE